MERTNDERSMKEMKKRDDTTTTTQDDVRACLRDMCRCVRREKCKRNSSPLYDLLHSWFVPRNERDVMCYIKRYRVWSRLPKLIVERMKREEKSV